MSGRVSPECRAQLTELFDYLDGELSLGRCEELERHLASCPCCGTLAARLRRATAVCRASGRTSLPKSIERRAKARIKDLLASGRTR